MNADQNKSTLPDEMMPEKFAKACAGVPAHQFAIVMAEEIEKENRGEKLDSGVYANCLDAMKLAAVQSPVDVQAMLTVALRIVSALIEQIESGKPELATDLAEHVGELLADSLTFLEAHTGVAIESFTGRNEVEN